MIATATEITLTEAFQVIAVSAYRMTILINKKGGFLNEKHLGMDFSCITFDSVFAV